MKTFFKLFKFQIDEIFDIFKSKDTKKFLIAVGKYILLLGLVTLVAALFLYEIFKFGFIINKQLVSIVLLATQLITFIFAVGSITTNLFLNKNNELLLSLPASPNQVFMSKLLVVYIHEVLVSTVYTIPILAVLGIFAKFSAWYFASLPIFMLILPILPLALAAFLSIPAMKLTNFLKRHLIVSSVLLLAVVAGIMYVYIEFLTVFATSFNIVNKMIDTIVGINTSIKSFGDGNWLFLRVAESMLAFKSAQWAVFYLASGILLLVCAIFLIRPFYFRAAMESNENIVSTASAKKSKTFKKRSNLMSLLIKEFLTVFRTPGYVFQYFLFTLLMPVIVLLYDKLLLTMVVNQAGQMMIAGSHVLIVAILAMLSNIVTASAISREGATFILIKTAPVNFYTQTLAKVLFNALLTVTALIATAIVTFFYLDAMVVIFTTLSVICASIAHICISFDMDLKSPTLDWYDNSEITQINKNTTKSMVYGLLIALVMCLIIFAFTGMSGSVFPWILLFILSLAYGTYRLFQLVLRVSYQYDRVEI